MKIEELKNFMEQTLEDSKNLLQKEGKLMPVAFIFHHDDVRIVGLVFRDEKEKVRQFKMLKKMVKRKDAFAIFVVVESWYVASREKLTMEPRLHPMRKECILVSGECEEGNTSIVQKFDRKDDTIIFGEKDYIDEVGFSIFNFGIKDRKRQDVALKELS